MTCYNRQFGGRVVRADKYECSTCHLQGSFAVCPPCAQRCHAGHSMRNVGQRDYTCDCRACGVAAPAVFVAQPMQMAQPVITTTAPCCDFYRHGRAGTRGKKYSCSQCRLTGRHQGICESCAFTCHRGHAGLRVSNGPVMFFCNCGERGCGNRPQQQVMMMAPQQQPQMMMAPQQPQMMFLAQPQTMPGFPNQAVVYQTQTMSYSSAPGVAPTMMQQMPLVQQQALTQMAVRPPTGQPGYPGYQPAPVAQVPMMQPMQQVPMASAAPAAAPSLYPTLSMGAGGKSITQVPMAAPAAVAPASTATPMLPMSYPPTNVSASSTAAAAPAAVVAYPPPAPPPAAAALDASLTPSASAPAIDAPTMRYDSVPPTTTTTAAATTNTTSAAASNDAPPPAYTTESRWDTSDDHPYPTPMTMPSNNYGKAPSFLGDDI